MKKLDFGQTISIPASSGVMIGIVFLGVATPALSHHSDAGLDMNSVVALEGTVVEFLWRNPHVYITIDSTDVGGDEIEWTLQAGAIPFLERIGWTRDSLVVGEHVTVEVHAARDGRPYGLVTSVTKQGGTVITTFVDAVIGTPDQGVTEPTPAATTLEGIWRVDSSNLVRGGWEGYFEASLQLTEKAKVAQSNFDEQSDQNPVSKCIGVSEPYITVLGSIFPIEISFNDEENTVSIRSGAGDYEQTVYLDGRGHPEDGERTLEGYAIGWWEEDTLVVDTRLFADHADPYQIGIPSGAQKHVIERYRLIEGGTRMEVQFTLEDHEFVAEPLIDTREMIYSPQAEIMSFDCDPESAARFLE